MSAHFNLEKYLHINVISEVLLDKAPYLAGVIGKQHARFGSGWLETFENDLATFFADDVDSLQTAACGYIKFALDGMLLQKRFDKTRVYESKSFEQASIEVYQNEQYMHTLYLPGIYLSHFLFRHHFLQYQRFLDRFVPMVKAHGGDTFYDVGVGTGFYSREMLRMVPYLRGEGFDLSSHSLSYTGQMISAFGLSNRYQARLRNILAAPPIPPVSFIVNVEVLEHLDDPVTFLSGLYRLLTPGGLGMITAAVTAPNADHIYLYNSLDDVVEQIKEAGFKVIDACEDAAYEPLKSTESVPRNAGVIVTK